MADVSKAVDIIFRSVDETGAVTQKIAEGLKGVGDAASSSGTAVDEAAKKIGAVGENSKTASPAVTAVGDGLRKLAADAGAPAPVLDSIDKLLLRIGGPAGGTAVVAAAAIAAFAISFARVGTEARDFKIALENVSGGAADSERALQFVIDTANRLETDISESLVQYENFLIKLEGTGISAEVAEKAFAGISAAVQGIGGDGDTAQKALDAFIKLARDGTIDVKDLGATIGQIPGGLRILSEALGVPQEDLRLLAKEGLLGKEAIELFADALNNQTYSANISPVSDAINALWNTLKEFSIDLGADGAAGGGLWILEKAVRAVTVGVTIGVESLKVYGETLANIAYSLANADGAGFLERQGEIMARFESGVISATDKFMGLETQLKNTEAPAATTKYADLAAKLKETGDKTETTKEKTVDLDKAAKEAAKSALDWERIEIQKAAALQKSAELTQKAEEAAQKFTVEMEKLASNERIKQIEFSVNLKIAELEETTKRIQSNFESLDNTINSSADVIKSLFAQIGQFDQLGFQAQNMIEDQLDAENKLRREAFELQKKLTEAQIQNLEAQTANMNKGDAIIKIDGAGLQPQLEAFMWEILKSIQTKVNSQGLAMLLGT